MFIGLSPQTFHINIMYFMFLFFIFSVERRTWAPGDDDAAGDDVELAFLLKSVFTLLSFFYLYQFSNYSGTLMSVKYA